MSKSVVVMSGVAGSGKSTHASSLPDPKVVISADDYFLQGNKFVFDPAKILQAHADCFRRFVNALLKGVPLVVVDNVNSNIEELSPYMIGAVAFGYNPEIITIQVTYLELPKMQRSKHKVPYKMICDQQYRISERVLPPWWRVSEIRPKFT
jgi:predicted kinase